MGCNNTVPFSPAKVIESPLPPMRGPLCVAQWSSVFSGIVISLPAPPYGCPNKVSLQAPDIKKISAKASGK